MITVGGRARVCGAECVGAGDGWVDVSIVGSLKRRCNWEQRLKVQEKKGARGQEGPRQGGKAFFQGTS